MLWRPAFAPVAQLDRVSVFETEGWEFKPLRARHITAFAADFPGRRAALTSRTLVASFARLAQGAPVQGLMRTYLSFETPVADIDARLDELRALTAKGDSPAIDEEIARARSESRQDARRALRRADPVAENAGRARPGPAPFQRLRQGPDRGFHAARRRPQVRRGRGDRRRPRAFPRPADLPDRPRERRRHGEPPQAQFRHGATRRLPQGGAADGARRPLRTAGRHRWSTPPAPGRASTPRSAARPRRSRARPTSACRWGRRTSRWWSAKAARAARWRSPPATRC